MGKILFQLPNSRTTGAHAPVVFSFGKSCNVILILGNDKNRFLVSKIDPFHFG
jgi:hypothetical protein